MSQSRYMWILFPAFTLLARWGERTWVDRLITTISLCGFSSIYGALCQLVLGRLMIEKISSLALKNMTTILF